MVNSALQKILMLTEGHRCDARLFEFFSSMAASPPRAGALSNGYLSTLPLEELMAQCRAVFPARGIPADTNLCLWHAILKRVITVAQR